VIIMGVDPGSNVTGYGIIKRDGNELLLISDGCVCPSRNLSFYERLFFVFLKLRDIIDTYKPTEIAIEDVFYHKNARSSLKLGHVRGAIIIASLISNIPVFEYSPLQVKKAVTGYGGATKSQVREMVKVILGVKKDMKFDSSDALAVAICHANSRDFVEK